MERLDSNNNNNYSDTGNRKLDQVSPSMFETNEQERKLFIGNIANISEQTLGDFFSQFGQVWKVIVKKDPNTGQNRGFGFVTMAKEEDVHKILNACPLEIKGKKIDVKSAKTRPICKKIFVGGIDASISKEEIKKFFSKYGTIEDVELPFDKNKKKRREFCFVIFENEQSANLACVELKQNIFGRECDVKKAQPLSVAQQQRKLQQSLNNQSNSSFQKQNKIETNSPNSANNGNNRYYNYKKSANRYNQNRKTNEAKVNSNYEYNNYNNINRGPQYLPNYPNNQFNKFYKHQMQFTQPFYENPLAHSSYYGYPYAYDFYHPHFQTAAYPNYPNYDYYNQQFAYQASLPNCANALNPNFNTYQVPNQVENVGSSEFQNVNEQYYPEQKQPQQFENNQFNQCFEVRNNQYEVPQEFDNYQANSQPILVNETHKVKLLNNCSNQFPKAIQPC